MAEARKPENEQERLHALQSYDVLDEQCDDTFERIIKVAADVCDVDISVIALIDQDRQFFFARNGMEPQVTPRAIAFCAHAILEPYETFEIPDATKDPRFADNPLVTGEPGVRFYAAQPLTTQEGLAIGGLCLIGKAPKSLSEMQRQTLVELANVIMSMLESRKTRLASERQLRDARDMGLAALKKIAEKSKALDDKNEQFSSALDNMTQGLCMYDRDQRLIICNRHYMQMYGLSEDLAKPGTRLSQVVRHRISIGMYAGESADDYMTERMEWGNTPKSERTVHQLSDGRTIAIVRRPLGCGGWVATHEDITELANAKRDTEQLNARLRLEKERFRSLYRNTPVMMHSIDEDGVVVEASEYWLSVMGYKPEEVIGRKTIQFMTEESRTYAFETVLPAFWRDGYCKDIPYQFIRKDGQIIDVRLSAIVSMNIEDGKRRSLACVVDVTDQIKAERKLAEINAALEKERERLNTIYRTTPVMLHSICEDGEIIEVSDYWCKKMGYAYDEVIGRSIYDFMSPVSAKVMRNENAPKLFAGGTMDNIHYTYVRKDGSRMEVCISAITGRNAQSQRLQTFSVVFDVTEKLRAEGELLQHRNQLRDLVNEATSDLKVKAAELEAALEREKELNKLQSQFVSVVSHEFRTPLAIIDSTAQRLAHATGETTHEQIVRRMGKIRDAVGRMTQLMETTLTSARLEAGHISVNLKACDIASVIYATCSSQQEISPNHAITCDMYGLPAEITADDQAVEQILTNLLSNAIKYSPENPDVGVRAYREHEEIVVEVQDSGLGIDDADIPHVFSRFFRAKSVAGIKGTGIGLDIVKKLVELHGGTISLTSAMGTGSTFTIRLPVNGPANEAVAA